MVVAVVELLEQPAARAATTSSPVNVAIHPGMDRRRRRPASGSPSSVVVEHGPSPLLLVPACVRAVGSKIPEPVHEEWIPSRCRPRGWHRGPGSGRLRPGVMQEEGAHDDRYDR